MSDILLTVKDVASILQCGEDAVIRRFAKMDGVIDLGLQSDGGSRKHLRVRRYRVLRIPKALVEQYLTAKSGRSVQVTIPVRPERRRKSPDWEDRAILNLAKAALQNECRDKKTFFQIAERARALASFVPENRWAEIIWMDDEE
jgi:hypothetical protein